MGKDKQPRQIRTQISWRFSGTHCTHAVTPDLESLVVDLKQKCKLDFHPLDNFSLFTLFFWTGIFERANTLVHVQWIFPIR